MTQTTFPFFSILLPTKNRSHLVGYAIRSVLQQDFTDLELIICDNDDDPNHTRQVVEEFYDPRVTYIRTGGLDMVANWNKTLNASKGQHIIILEDKMIFYPDALTTISNNIQNSPSKVVVWKCDVIEDDRDYPILIQQPISSTEVLSSNSTLEKVVTAVMTNWSILPRGICCSLPRDLINLIVKTTNTPFYEKYSPDFISSLKTLSFIDEYLFLGEPLNLISSNKFSNGKRILKRQDNSYYTGNNEKTPLIYNQANWPFLKNEWIVTNSVISDYIKQQELIKRKLVNFKITNKNYFKMLFHEFLSTSINERHMTWEWQEIRQLLFCGDGLIKNLIYSAGFMATLLKNKIIENIKKNDKKYSKRNLSGTTPASMIDNYLNGKMDILNRKSYTVMHR